jgi:hypothetical protein
LFTVIEAIGDMEDIAIEEALGELEAAVAAETKVPRMNRRIVKCVN